MKYIVSLLLFCQILQAQEFTYFNKQLEFPNNNLVIASTLPLSDGYLVFGSYITSGINTIYAAKLDFKGDFVSLFPLDDSPELGDGGVGTGESLIRTNDGHFVGLYSKYKDIIYNDMESALVKFTINGEIIWRKTYGVTGETLERAYHLLETKDKGLLISGFRDSGHFRFLAIKMDSEGNVEWEKEYSMGYHASAGEVYETIDGGYILSNWSYSIVNDYQMYMVKINDEGKLQWQKEYGTEGADTGGHLFPLSSGEYLLTGALSHENTLQSYMAKLNSDGNILWERRYEDLEDLGYFFFTTKVIFQEGNDSFICGANFFNDDGNANPVIMNFNIRGDILWTKPITADPNASVYMRDIEKIEGGYVLAGQRFSPPQYGWILTIDEEGNTCSEGRTYTEPDFEGCDSTVVFTDIPHFPASNPYQVQVAPNPVHQQTTIHYQLPIQYSMADLQLYDLQGVLVREWRLETVENKRVLDLEGLANGVYFYRLGAIVGKLVVDN